MNTNVDLTLSLAADGSALPSLFFRPADRLRLEGCVAALTQEGRSLALSSEHEAALDHYAKLLTERLRRAAPKSQVETYFPASTDAQDVPSFRCWRFEMKLSFLISYMISYKKL
jgi:hypothetical protein